MQRKVSGIAITALVAVFAVGSSMTAIAETSAEDAKDYRQAMMHAMGGHMSAISMNVRGLVEDHGFMAEHAEALAHAAAELEYIFPAGSDVDDSEALPAIWDEPDAFAGVIADAEQATAAFSEAAASGDKEAIDAAFREVASACKGCHDRFRMDDD